MSASTLAETDLFQTLSGIPDVDIPTNLQAAFKAGRGATSLLTHGSDRLEARLWAADTTGALLHALNAKGSFCLRARRIEKLVIAGHRRSMVWRWGWSAE